MVLRIRIDKYRKGKINVLVNYPETEPLKQIYKAKLRSQRPQGTQWKDQARPAGQFAGRRGYKLNDHHACPSPHQASLVDIACRLREALPLLPWLSGASARLSEVLPEGAGRSGTSPAWGSTFFCCWGHSDICTRTPWVPVTISPFRTFPAFSSSSLPGESPICLLNVHSILQVLPWRHFSLYWAHHLGWHSSPHLSVFWSRCHLQSSLMLAHEYPAHSLPSPRFYMTYHTALWYPWVIMLTFKHLIFRASYSLLTLRYTVHTETWLCLLTWGSSPPSSLGTLPVIVTDGSLHNDSQQRVRAVCAITPPLSSRLEKTWN